MKVEISKAIDDLPRLISLVNKGERVTIVKDNKPVADLVKPGFRRERNLGILRGKLSLPDDFNDENEEINSMFYGKEK